MLRLKSANRYYNKNSIIIKRDIFFNIVNLVRDLNIHEIEELPEIVIGRKHNFTNGKRTIQQLFIHIEKIYKSSITNKYHFFIDKDLDKSNIEINEFNELKKLITFLTLNVEFYIDYF